MAVRENSELTFTVIDVRARKYHFSIFIDQL